jgi:predicted DNA-binding WGR domain protein
VKAWGRIGARGRMMDEWHMTEAEAIAALQRQAERKRRRGYARQQGLSSCLDPITSSA